MLPGLSAGGSIPITGGAATSGDVQSLANVDFGPVNIAGLFGSTAGGGSPLVPIAVTIAVGILAWQLLKR